MIQGSLTSAAFMTPVQLNYVAALKGIAPRAKGEGYIYASIGCRCLDTFLGLAASNLDGSFVVVMNSDIEAASARAAAKERNVSNITIITNTNQLPMVDYLVCNSVSKNDGISTTDLAAIAAKHVKPSGLCVHRYNAYSNTGETLRFLVNEFSPEMNAAQATTFLHELKALGSLYFSGNPIARVSLDSAISKNMPDEFFSACDVGAPAHSGAFDSMVAMLPAGFSYVGDADVGSNYMEISTPKSAHETLISCRDNILYEVIKDFSLQRTERCDIWCKQPVALSSNPFALYNEFTFGTLLQKNEIPSKIEAKGITIDLTKAPYAALIDLITLMPVSLGDCVGHSTLVGVTPEELTSAMHLLVACSVAQPMRGSYTGFEKANIAHPQWATPFNLSTGNATIANENIIFASPVIGGPVRVSARDALVLQAISRVGMADCVTALVPELQRILANPTLATQVMGTESLSQDFVQIMIKEVVNRSMIQWYTYGVLAA